MEVKVRRSEGHWSPVSLATFELVSEVKPTNNCGQSCGCGWPRVGGVPVNVFSWAGELEFDEWIELCVLPEVSCQFLHYSTLKYTLWQLAVLCHFSTWVCWPQLLGVLLPLCQSVKYSTLSNVRTRIRAGGSTTVEFDCFISIDGSSKCVWVCVCVVYKCVFKS